MSNSTELLLKSLTRELSKTYIALDGQDRGADVYTARAGAAHGDLCLLTEYEYKDPTSTIIIKRKESESTWDSSWDI